jgi:PLP dependent protein
MSPVARLQTVQQSIANHCQQAGRESHTVGLLAVSKLQSVAAIQALYELGLRRFGENYIAEGCDKIPQLPSDIEWHLIGPIQSNKTKDVAAHFHWVHSLDRDKIAQRLNDQRPDHLPPLACLIQLNISQEDSKSGIDVSDTNSINTLADLIASLPKLQLRGLMAMAAPDLTEAQTRAQFHTAHAVYLALQQRYPSIDTLSIGMSADMGAAIAEGSSLLRVGTALFGARA